MYHSITNHTSIIYMSNWRLSLQHQKQLTCPTLTNLHTRNKTRIATISWKCDLKKWKINSNTRLIKTTKKSNARKIWEKNFLGPSAAISARFSIRKILPRPDMTWYNKKWRLVVEYNPRPIAHEAHNFKSQRKHKLKRTHERITIVMENKTSSAICTSAYLCMSQAAVPVSAYPASHKLSANHRPGLSSPT